MDEEKNSAEAIANGRNKLVSISISAEEFIFIEALAARLGCPIAQMIRGLFRFGFMRTPKNIIDLTMISNIARLGAIDSDLLLPEVKI